MKSIMKLAVVALMLTWVILPATADSNCCNYLTACQSVCGNNMSQCEASYQGCVPCQWNGGCNGWPPCLCSGCAGGAQNDVCHVALSGCMQGCANLYNWCCL